MSKPALVIFDLDNTILNGDSDYAMINYLVHTQALDESVGKQNQIFIEDYQRGELDFDAYTTCLLYTSPSPRDRQKSRMPSSA